MPSFERHECCILRVTHSCVLHFCAVQRDSVHLRDTHSAFSLSHTHTHTQHCWTALQGAYARVTCVYARRDSFLCPTKPLWSLSHTHILQRRFALGANDVCICATWLIYMCDITPAFSLSHTHTYRYVCERERTQELCRTCKWVTSHICTRHSRRYVCASRIRHTLQRTLQQTLQHTLQNTLQHTLHRTGTNATHIATHTAKHTATHTHECAGGWK